MNDDDALSKLIRQQATYHKAQDSLRAEILSRIALEAASHTSASSGAASAKPKSGRWAWPWHWDWRAWLSGPTFAAFCAGAFLAAAVMWPMVRQPWPFSRTLEAQLVDAHVHAMAQGPLIEVASSDRHTVKPWLQGKIDYAPTVLATAGNACALTGARIDKQLRDQPTAVLVYACKQHVVSLFVWPEEHQQMPAAVQVRGFHLRRWSEGAMQYWLVSDMDVPAIDRFILTWTAPPGHAEGAASSPPP